MKHSQKPKEPVAAECRGYTIPALCRRYGVSRSTIYRLIQAGVLSPARRLGGVGPRLIDAASVRRMDVGTWGER